MQNIRAWYRYHTLFDYKSDEPGFVIIKLEFVFEAVVLPEKKQVCKKWKRS